MKPMMLVLLAACACSAPQKKEDAPAPELTKPEAARAAVKAALDALPACTDASQARPLTIATTFCTRKYCNTPCCNACGWVATQPGADGAPTPVDGERVKSVLKLDDKHSLDCEVIAWGEAVAGQSVSFDESACVAR